MPVRRKTANREASGRVGLEEGLSEGESPHHEESRREGGHVLEMQRRRLLLGYSDVLAELGLEGVSVDRVCKRAGVSRRTFYDLFADRDACFLAAFEGAVDRIAAVVVPLYTAGGRWRVRLRSSLTALLELFDAEPAVARMCVVEVLKAGPSVLERRRSLLAALAGAIDEGWAEGRGASPPPLTAEGVIGGVLSVIHARLLAQPHTGLTRNAFAGSSSRDGNGRGSDGSFSRDGNGRRSDEDKSLVGLVNPLMSMIVHPYLGPAAAARELARPAPNASSTGEAGLVRRVEDPFKDLPIRFTFRTARVLSAVGTKPGASNRAIGDVAGIADQGQISKLLGRLERSGLIDNSGEGHSRGEPNAWTLTERGEAIQRTIDPPGRERTLRPPG
jgi:AcrR family transcriptional regulator/DNA-binding MarR family transcriptional regulator